MSAPTNASAWPAVIKLTTDFADEVRRTAIDHQRDCQCSTEDVAATVHAAAKEAVDQIAAAMVAAAEMALDVWGATR